MVSGEGVKGSELRPAHAQLLRGVLGKAADVRAHQRNAQEIERQHACEKRKRKEKKQNTLAGIRYRLDHAPGKLKA